MSKISVLATTALPMPQGLSLWVSMLSGIAKTTVPLRSGSFDYPTFNGQVECAEVGRIKLCKINATPHRIVRHNASSPLGNNSTYKVIVQARGTSILEQSNGRAHLSPGEWSVYDSSKPYSVTNQTEVEQYVILLPRDVLVSPRFQIETLLLQPFSARHGSGRLACELVRSAMEEISMQQVQSSDHLADSVTLLFQQALLDRIGKSNCASRTELLRDKIKIYVQTHLCDPNLSIDRLARDLDCTKRTLHRVFAPEGHTISDLIWQMRLEASRRALSNEELAHQSITGIAYACGFSNSAHFSRAFKEAFGLSPREYRMGAQNDDPAAMTH